MIEPLPEDEQFANEIEELAYKLFDLLKGEDKNEQIGNHA